MTDLCFFVFSQSTNRRFVADHKFTRKMVSLMSYLLKVVSIIWAIQCKERKKNIVIIDSVSVQFLVRARIQKQLEKIFRIG